MGKTDQAHSSPIQYCVVETQSFQDQFITVLFLKGTNSPEYVSLNGAYCKLMELYEDILYSTYYAGLNKTFLTISLIYNGH
jgi:hypothetical protein